ncbi:Opioid growth factor receptor [Liparis tanakae]|uniref:Opioid growth factor receptor n=1 Tax=Liparis tanakae TaxID=230148 RepID=A0A4Z2GUL2_9TELE|nr:Opioid growth factor receptor [Liparis tanakae]
MYVSLENNLKRSACSFWRCAKRVLYPIGPYVFPLRWRERSGGDPGELERSGGDAGELERSGGDAGELERSGGDAGELKRNSDPGELERNSDPGELERNSDPGELERNSDPGELERNSDPGELERKSGDLVELERNGGDPQKVEDSRPEGQHEAAGADAPAGKRAADSDRELAPKRPKFEEEEGEFGGEEYRVDPSEDWCCGYDSTWEAEEPPRGARPRTRRPAAHYSKFGRFESASRDMQNYRHGYPDDKPNLQFYLGNKCSEPDGRPTVTNTTPKQALFQKTTEFCANDTAKANLLTSYRLMLDFYGIELCDENNGEVKRASNWKERFKNLNCRTHNNLRITRILKCLGTLGYPHYQAPLVRFFLEETLVHGELPAVKDSVLGYFLFAVLDKEERRKLVKFAFLSYSPKEEFVWCPGKIQRIWSRGIGGGNEARELKRSPLSQYSDDEGRDEET